jgi:PST family polysaccharide transporter
MFLCDVGLSGALVRQSHAPSKDEAVTVFWCQQAFTLIAAGTIVSTAPLLAHLYKLPHSADLLIVTMGLGLFFSSLRIVPMMALERDLQFPKIALCELIENIVQTASTIVLAALGCGAWALVGGGLLRGIVGLGCVWAASPWRPAGRFQFAIVQRLAAFGIAFQLNAIVPSLAGGWAPLIVGRLLGVTALGFVGWATNIASVPLMLSGIINRVAFPSYSRLQSEPEALGRYLGASIRRLGAVFSLLSPILVIICPVLIPILFRARWIPAIPLVQWFSLECAILTITGLLATTQNAAGNSGERLAVTLFIGICRWGMAFFTVRHFPLQYLGPCMFTVSFSELVLTAFLVQRRNAGYLVIFLDAFEPVLVGGGFLVVALIAGRTIAGGQVLYQTLTSLILFVGLILSSETLSGKRVFQKELHAIALMMKPVSQKS